VTVLLGLMLCEGASTLLGMLRQVADGASEAQLESISVLNASRQGLRGNDTMGKRVWKSEEKEGNCDSPNHLTPIRYSDPC